MSMLVGFFAELQFILFCKSSNSGQDVFNFIVLIHIILKKSFDFCNISTSSGWNSRFFVQVFRI